MESVNGKVIKKAGVKKMEGEGRPVAVDWALSKEKWEETQKVEKVDVDASSLASSSSSGDDDEGSNAKTGTSLSGNEDANELVDGVEDPDAMDEDEPVKPQLPTVDVGATLFIRNVPFESTEQELNTL